MPESAIAAIVSTIAEVSASDVAIGALAGGALSAIQGGNILEGAALGGITGGLLPVGGNYLGAELGSQTLGYGLVGAGLGAADSAITGGNVLQGAALGGAGGAITGALSSTPTTASPTGAAPSASGATSGGGFTSPTSLLSDQNQSILDQLGTSGGGTSQAVTGSTTPGATSLGSVSDSSGLTSGGGSSFPGSSSLGSNLSEAGTASNFTSGSGISSGDVSPTSGVGSSNFGDISSGINNFSNTSLSSPNLTQVPNGLESGGGASLPPDFATSTAPSTNTSSGFLGTGDLTGGGGLQSSTGVPVADSSLGSQISDWYNGNSISSIGGSSSGSGGSLGALKYALPLGELGKTLIDGPQKLPSNAQPLEAGGSVTGPLQDLEKQSLNAYNSQTLTPGQQAQIDQYTQNAQNALYQQLAGSGVTNPNQDSRFIQGMQQIQQQAEAMKQQLLQTDLSAGTGAAGQASQNLFGTAELQNKQDEDYQNSIAAAIAAFGQMSGGGSIGSIEKLLGAG